MKAASSIQAPIRKSIHAQRTALALAFAFSMGTLATLAVMQEAQARPVAVQQRNAAVTDARLDAYLSELRNDADAAADLMRWLQQHAPGDAARQTQILTDFADALEADGAGDRVVALLYGVLQVKDVEFEPALIARLARNASAEQLVRASMLSYRGGFDVARIGQLVRGALDKDPESLLLPEQRPSQSAPN
jgi:hypothetical protein